jgi:hypothetical protein
VAFFPIAAVAKIIKQISKKILNEGPGRRLLATVDTVGRKVCGFSLDLYNLSPCDFASLEKKRSRLLIPIFQRKLHQHLKFAGLGALGGGVDLLLMLQPGYRSWATSSFSPSWSRTVLLICRKIYRSESLTKSSVIWNLESMQIFHLGLVLRRTNLCPWRSDLPAWVNWLEREAPRWCTSWVVCANRFIHLPVATAVFN